MNDVAKKPETSTESLSLRTMSERLGDMLSRVQEAWHGRELRRTLDELKAINDPHLSDVEGGRLAAGVAAWYAQASAESRRNTWLLMSEQFAPDVSALEQARADYEAALRTPEEARAEVALRRAIVTPRTRLLQRFAAYPEGMAFLVNLRAEILPELKNDPRLAALDAELEQLFSTWLDVGFLDLRRINWDSPARLVEKLIEYEAVHDITSWADVKNRLDDDRRCYGFFHPRLPGEPLIFVEVALLRELAAAIPPLLDEQGDAADLPKASTAIFYSISNTQKGLKGVSFGDSLIKRVVAELKREFPQLKTFATLSPIPGLRHWLKGQAEDLIVSMPDKQRRVLERELDSEPLSVEQILTRLDDADALRALPEKSALRAWLLRAGARYLGHATDRRGRPLDAVARFHLGNGARVERINWLGDPSAKGLKQSYGLMVNYLYDLGKLDKHRTLLASGEIPVSGAVQSLQD
ncbi:malonyl-CoA decarboxylase [Ottowia sp.]|uniref:malonyl-CoA decarboxylase n=1 Tax=Ottowia sp. TaxID=1898956 RepID=UPI003A867B5F